MIARATQAKGASTRLLRKGILFQRDLPDSGGVELREIRSRKSGPGDPSQPHWCGERCLAPRSHCDALQQIPVSRSHRALGMLAKGKLPLPEWRWFCSGRHESLTSCFSVS